MNQIIYYMKSEYNNDDNIKKYSKQKNRYFFIFYLFIVFTIFCIIIYIFFHFSKDDNYSNKLISNYNISQLYNNISPTLINASNSFSVLGIIEIPNLKITYPILSECTDNNLKIAPCRVFGPNIGENGNICIIGHNYDNSLFFSNINSLHTNDKILLYDLDGNSYSYIVTSTFEVANDDLSILEKSNNMELTLITCNNFNSNRYIVKAKSC